MCIVDICLYLFYAYHQVHRIVINAFAVIASYECQRCAFGKIFFFSVYIHCNCTIDSINSALYVFSAHRVSVSLVECFRLKEMHAMRNMSGFFNLSDACDFVQNFCFDQLSIQYLFTSHP